MNGGTNVKFLTDFFELAVKNSLLEALTAFLFNAF
jgi:hypothetical protein